MAVSISLLSHDAVGLFLLIREDLLSCCDEQEASFTELSVLVTVWLGDVCCDRNSAKHGAAVVQEPCSFVFKAFVPRSKITASFDDTCEGETLGDLRLLKAIVFRFLLPLVISSFN